MRRRKFTETKIRRGILVHQHIFKFYIIQFKFKIDAEFKFHD